MLILKAAVVACVPFVLLLSSRHNHQKLTDISKVRIPIFFSIFRSVKRKDEDKPVLYRGQVTLSVDLARRGTNYKYLVVKNGNITWEDLSEYGSFRRIVNRVLKVPEEDNRPGGKLE